MDINEFNKHCVFKEVEHRRTLENVLRLIEEQKKYGAYHQPKYRFSLRKLENVPICPSCGKDLIVEHIPNNDGGKVGTYYLTMCICGYKHVLWSRY